MKFYELIDRQVITGDKGLTSGHWDRYKIILLVFLTWGHIGCVWKIVITIF